MIIVICGPTGVGKTKLSIALAKKYNGIIINADGTQIYKSLDIGSAKATADEKEQVKHYLLDIINPNEEYSVSDYQKDARKIIDNNKDKTIIMVGGSGLYIKAALYDYKFNERKELDLSNYSLEELGDLVLKINKDIDIDKNNRRRLESFIKSGKKEQIKSSLMYDALFIGLTIPRKELYERINKRVDKMICNGLIDEVKNLYKIYPTSRILHSAIGYKEMISYLDNELSLESTADLIKKNSRHYAKRQYTWFNNQMNITWFDNNDFDKTILEVENYIDNKIK